MTDIPSKGPTAQCDVLVVEDEVELADIMVSYLARGGLQVRAAHSGSSAHYALDRVRPYVAVLDYNLPDVTGVELATSIHERLPHLPIIMMSGAIGGLDKATMDASGIKVLLNKPVPLRALLRAILQLRESAHRAE